MTVTSSGGAVFSNTMRREHIQLLTCFRDSNCSHKISIRQDVSEKLDGCILEESDWKPLQTAASIKHHNDILRTSDARVIPRPPPNIKLDLILG